jgi:8-oxo-dGTP pyrophosphatase MutT (NUDIX family)
MLKQYGTIPFIREKGKIKVVLVTSTAGYWIFPKGRYEKGRGKRGTAELEALEEAGVKGKLHRKCNYRTKVVIKSGDRVKLTLYALEVKILHDEWPEDRSRKRTVVTVEEAEKLIDSDALRSCLRRFERDFLM